MQLVSNWGRVLRRAWSVRFILAAGVLSGAEIALPYLEPSIPSRMFAVLSAIATGGALIARLVAQKGVSDADQ
jgi:hypothetical protein